MLDSRSHDLLTLARVALQAAIRCEADLVALLDQPDAAWARRARSGKGAVVTAVRILFLLRSNRVHNS
jgi:hypothetical protein